MFELDLILKRARKIWDNNAVFHSILIGESLFPLYLDLPAVSSAQLTNSFVQIRSSMQLFIDKCKLHNIGIVCKEINHRQFGEQKLPKQVYFNELHDYLRFIGKLREYRVFIQEYDYILGNEPMLYTWLTKNPGKILEYQDKWPVLLKVCNYFLEHPIPSKYIRELGISGVDSKFIEQHKGILTLLLNELLPPEAINTRTSINKRHDFEVRFGLKYIEPVIRLRILDKALMLGANNWCGNITDYTLPLNEFLGLNIPCDKIFITENKINGLSFPDVKGAIIIFGLGYGIELLKNVPWFKNKDIIYWGDIDTHGFAMLSQLRSYYPLVRSVLMDLATLNSCKDMWVSEPIHTRCTAHLPNLTIEEQKVYQMLLRNQLGTHIRLEQERVSYHCLANVLRIL